jgi:SAM-dependent methyltransferase
VEGDAARWDDRYRSVAPARPSPPDALAGLDDDLIPRRGRMLDVACGLGAQAVWGAQRGLDVTAFDASAVAVDRALALATDAGVSIRALRVDVDDLAGFDALTDLDLGGSFDLVVCQRFRDPRLYPLLVDALTPGGLLVVTVLSSVGCDTPGPFHAPPGELASAIGTDHRLEIIRVSEGDGEASIVARRRQGTDTVV